MTNEVEVVKKKLDDLVVKFKLANYRTLNEDQTRLSFIDPFWEILGWNIRDITEVQIEKTEKNKRPDYRFFHNSKTVFFVEAKKPAENLINPKHIYQTKLYCWNGGVPLAILTDFEEFRPFLTIGKPNIYDSQKGLIKEFDMKFEEYADRAYDLLNTFGREAVKAGSLDKLYKPTQKELKDTVDNAFLQSLTTWRKILAENIAKNNRFDNEFDLSEAVQRILDRIVFIRILGDREIENEDLLKRLIETDDNKVQEVKVQRKETDVYELFVELCRRMAPKYNGLIFNPHPISEDLRIDDYIFKPIISEFIYENSPYRFDEMPVEVLGTIYEKFLGDEINLDSSGKVEINQKPEVRKAGGVYYTPQYIVEYIVQNTVGKLLEKCKTPDDVAKLKILDPACGSGSFLLGAFDLLIKWHEEYFSEHPTQTYEKTKGQIYTLAYIDDNGKMKLTARMKGRILLNNIYGVDLDRQATEVAQMSLYIKVLEGLANEPQHTMGFYEALLPKLDGNIKCGNSLIGTDFITDDFFELSAKEKHRINPFDWDKEFPEIIKPKKKEVKAYHITWVTYNSRDKGKNNYGSEVILDEADRNQIAFYLDEKIKKEKYSVIACNVLTDHVHILVVCEEKELSKIVGQLKGYSSYEFHENATDPRKSVYTGIHRNDPTVNRRVDEGGVSVNYRDDEGEEYADLTIHCEDDEGWEDGSSEENDDDQGNDPTVNRRVDVGDGSVNRRNDEGDDLVNHRDDEGEEYTEIDLTDHREDDEEWEDGSSEENYEDQRNDPTVNRRVDGGDGSVNCRDDKGDESTEINLTVHREGKQQATFKDGTIKKLWAKDFSHTYLNTEEHIRNAINYIENNHLKHKIPALTYKFQNLTSIQKAFSKEEAGGFDAVIGNPPWVDIKGHPPVLVKYYFKYFITTENRINLYSIFIENGLRILNKKGKFGMIVPNSMLYQSSYEKLRKFILNFFKIEKIVRLPDNTFQGVKAESIVIIIGFEKIDTVCIIYDRKDIIFEINKNNALEINYFNADNWQDNQYSTFDIFVNSKIRDLLIKIETNKIELQSIVEFSLGITPYDKYKGHTKAQIENRVFHSTEKKDSTYKRLLEGSDVNRYNINWGGKEYLSYGKWLGAPRDVRFFKEERILIRQIVSGNPLRIYAGFTDEELLNTQTIFNIILKKNIQINIKYLLALINSKLINFYHKNKYLDLTKHLFQKILIQNCKKLPIANINFSNQKEKLQHDRLVELVERMLKLHKEKQTANEFDRKQIEQYIERTDREIDMLVYELYGLTEEEIRIVEEEES